MKKSLNVVFVGCLHGKLDSLYEAVDNIEKSNKMTIDLVLVNGDFQSMRNEKDLKSMSCPIKYRKMGDFYKYWNGTKKAPYLTIFVGGNHEASKYLSSLYYGGWVAENIYYLGKCGVINVNGFRIAGFSGIHDTGDYLAGYFESFPLTEIRSIYHTREYEILKGSLIEGKIDIVMSHDWPLNVAKHGDYMTLLGHRKDLLEEINQSLLGNPGTGYLLTKLKPYSSLIIIVKSGYLHTYISTIERQLNTVQMR